MLITLPYQVHPVLLPHLAKSSISRLSPSFFTNLSHVLPKVGEKVRFLKIFNCLHVSGVALKALFSIGFFRGGEGGVHLIPAL